MAKICEGVGGLGGGWFRGRILIKVGNGTNTFFWTEMWVRWVPLLTRFRRLYDLSVNKSCTVYDIFVFGWEEGGESWKWWRRLWDWEEEMVRECRRLLSNAFLQEHSLA